MRSSLAIFAILALSGCGPVVVPGVPGLAQIDVLTVVGTDKTVVDHVLSLSSGKNCSAVRLEKGMHYCEEDEPKITQNIYCYNTLGSVTCYTKPDPHKGGYQKIGENQHNLVQPAPANRP